MLALMISSQLLLTGFVSYWLIGRYKSERMNLQVQLHHEFLSAYDQQVDSLLMKHLITPTLNDFLKVSNSGHTSVVIKHLESDTSPQPEIIAFRMDDSTGLEEERLVRSVKLFINETDEAYRSNDKAHVFSMNIDSLALLLMLEQKFEEQEWKFKMDWLEASDEMAQEDQLQGIVLTSNSHSDLSALHIQHIAPHLLSIMLPQFIFALILLSLSASAMIIAYRSLTKQVALNVLRNDFIANISHELKTPVSTVKVALEALQKFDLKNDPKISEDYLLMASREVDRLEGLVGKVLQHQVLEDSEALMQKEACDLQQMISSVVQAMEIPIREKKASLHVQEAELPCTVMADPIYLEGVLINLIDNSLKYADTDPVIHIATACTGSRIQLTVKDNGPGIPDEFKHQVFDKFFRIPAGNRHNVKGYGLGLNFAAQVMAHLGGSISFRNLPGKGCEFILDFPQE